MIDAIELMNDPERAWSPYEPDAAQPWDRQAVAHLHRRAGFAAPWAVLERDLGEGPGPSLRRLLEGEPASGDGQPAAAFEARHDAMARSIGGSGNLPRLQAVWLHRMILTPHPLRERMTLFWHDHFATSNNKVGNPALMRRQNALLRQHALGDFGALLTSMAKDPAMLIWLDSATNRKTHPNENYAREVMELFTLGRGHYSEKDIQEAARAFTGFFVQGDRFRVVASQHDAGEKTILGKSGPFEGDDVARILLDQPACAEYVCGKLFRHFVSEVDEPSPALIAPLASAFRDQGYAIAVPVGMILRSRLFFDPAVRRRRVKSPVELTVGTVRALEILKPTVSSDALAEVNGRMGQGLYVPPSVAGWDGGPAWINTTTTLARTNFMLDLLGDDDRLGKRFDAAELAERHGASSDVAGFYADLLVQDAFDRTVRDRLKGTPKEIATLVLTSPEYQLA
jgi:uncharacterized protein (DUF1800 family)